MTWTPLRTLTTAGPDSSTPSDPAAFVAPTDAGAWCADQNRIRYLEIAFDDWALTRGATSVTLGLWRLSDGALDRVASLHFGATPPPVPSILEVHGSSFALSVESLDVAGGAVTASARMRPVRR
jgi:hypothetical protein